MQNIFILTGAGISAESGLKTFRDAGGLWEGHRIEDVATPEAFATHPQLVHDFYNARRSQLRTVEPNPAHHALVRLQQHYNAHLTLVTQNVDDLHERADMRDVIHMHGELLKKSCTRCNAVRDCVTDISVNTPCEDCGSMHTMRPQIVWFGEMPLRMDEIHQKLIQTDLLIAIGTSGMVYPAAGFAAEAKCHGAQLIEANLLDTGITSIFDEHLEGPATQTIPVLVDRIIKEARQR